jgi:hypothetical protein
MIDRGVQARPRGMINRRVHRCAQRNTVTWSTAMPARPAVPPRHGRTGRTSGGSSDTGLTKVIDDQVKFDRKTARGLLQHLADIPELLSPEP